MKFDDLKSSFEPAPEGPALGVLVAFIDRGEQAGKFAPRRQAMLHWLLPEAETENGEPCLVFQVIWNLSMKEDFSDAYWNRLWQWYEAEGYRHVTAYLDALDLSTFDPKRRHQKRKPSGISSIRTGRRKTLKWPTFSMRSATQMP
jgi:hypothetical protein